MQEIRQIPLQEIIDLAEQFVKGEKTQEDLDHYGEELMVRQYIGLAEKRQMALNIISNKQYLDTTVEEYHIAQLYKYLFFDGMLRYIFIDTSDDTLKTDANYDLLYPIFAPFILSMCKDDYELFVAMVKDSITMYNWAELNSALSLTDVEALDNTTKSNKTLLEELSNNIDVINKLSNIAILNNPSLGALTANVKQAMTLEQKLNTNTAKAKPAKKTTKKKTGSKTSTKKPAVKDENTVEEKQTEENNSQTE